MMLPCIEEGGDGMTIRPGASRTVPREELEAHAVEALPERPTMSLLGGSLFAAPVNPTDVAGFVSQASAAGGDTNQTAPVVQGLTSPPQLPTI